MGVEKGTDEIPEPQNSASTSAPYSNVIFALVCFATVAATVAFSLAHATAQGFSDAFTQDTVSLLGLVLTGIWAARSWSNVIRLEPETNCGFRDKHRSFGLKVGAVISAALAGAAAMGAYSGMRAGHEARVGALMKQVSQLGVESAPAKQQFAQAARRGTHSLPEYLERCADLEASINTYEPALQRTDSLLEEAQQELQDLKADARFATLLTTVVAIRSVLQKDLQSVGAFRVEIGYAKQLSALPEADRDRFYAANIQPVVDEEDRIAKDEIEILRDAKARGVKLPQKMYSESGIN